MSYSPETLRSSYDQCRRIARQSRSSFTPCFRLLFGGRRRAMEALYAFMRHTDDLADADATAEQAEEALGRWREQTTDALAGRWLGSQGDERILPAVADMVERFEIPDEYLFDVIDGVGMDLSKQRYETFDELADYCYRVATVVGLACLRIWGYRGEDPHEAAHACGMAFQLTNILRDLREDLERGRVYLPQEELRRFNYSEDDLAAVATDDRFRELMRLETDRAERFYWTATELAGGLDGGGRRIFVMMIRVYYRLLKQIQADPGRVLRERVCLGRWRPLAIMARTMLRPSAKAVLP